MVATLVGVGTGGRSPAPEGGQGGPREKVRLGKVNLSPRQCGGHQGGMLAVGQSSSLAAAFQSLPVQVGPRPVGPSGREETSNAVLVCFALRGPVAGRGGGAGRVGLPGHRGRPGDPGVRASNTNPRPWEQAG
ncbi:MAG: hypothetical protein ACLS43_11530 [Evtepia gabavorous]